MVYGKFARYWADSLAHYADIGIAPDYITIENEPSFIPPSWEGCKFEPSETAAYPGFDRALVAVKDAIAHMSPPLAHPPKILAPEVLGIHDGLLEADLKPMDVGRADGIAHHLYEKGKDGVWVWRSPGPEAFAADMRAAAAATNKPLYETEFQTDEDRGIDGGFETAWLMHLSLVEEGVVAFLYWNLVWDQQGGLVSIHDHKAHARDQYFCRAPLRAIHRSGGRARGRAVGHAGDPCVGVRVAGGRSRDGHRPQYGIVGHGDPRRPGGFPRRARASAFRTVFRPGASETWTPVWPDSGESLRARSMPLPARSMATIVLGR